MVNSVEPLNVTAGSPARDGLPSILGGYQARVVLRLVFRTVYHYIRLGGVKVGLLNALS